MIARIPCRHKLRFKNATHVNIGEHAFETGTDFQPRNFVLLYLESVERSYLDETRFPGLMPNLAAPSITGLDAERSAG